MDENMAGPTKIIIDVSRLETDHLEQYDRMMLSCIEKLVDPFAQMACWMWSDCLRELDLRGCVTLLEGSYDDPYRSRISRRWAE